MLYFSEAVKENTPNAHLKQKDYVKYIHEI